MLISRLIAFSLFFFLCVAPAVAQVPGSMQYQGYLTDSVGAPVDSAAPLPITFHLYAVETGGAPIWSETLAVNVSQGLFSVALGAAPLNPFLPGTFDTPLFLGIVVASDLEMTPRRPITTVAFSFKAADAESLQGRSAADLDQAAAVTALATNSVIALDGVLAQGGGGEAVVTAPGGLLSRNSAAGPDIVVGGLDGSDSGDDGVISSNQALPSSDLVIQSNDAVVIDLDSDGGGEDADFLIRDRNQAEIFNVEEDGQVRLHGVTSLRAADDPMAGPIITLGGDASDQTESGRIRFFEGTASSNWRGAYVHYDGAGNTLHLGVHDASDDDPAMDRDVINIQRSSGRVGLNTAAPSRELTVNDVDGNGDSILNMTAVGRELLIGVNLSSGGLIAMQTNNDLQFRTNGTSRMTIDAGGDVQVSNNLVLEGQAQRDYGSAQYMPFAPVARGTITDIGATINLHGATANVMSFGYPGPYYELTLTNPCVSGAGVPLLSDYQLLVTPGGRVDDFNSSVVCVSNKVVLRVELRGAFGASQRDDFSFVLFGP